MLYGHLYFSLDKTKTVSSENSFIFLTACICTYNDMYALLQSLPDYIILCYYIHFITLLLFFVKRESFSSVKLKNGMSFFI